MGLKEGINIAATAENIKNQRARRLSEEERAKVYMEIAKMGAEIQKQQFDMQKESHEMSMQTAVQQRAIQEQERSAALLDMHKQTKLGIGRNQAFGQIDQFRQAETGNVDWSLFFREYLEKNAQFMEPKDVQHYVDEIQEAERGQAWKPKTKEDWREKYIFEQKHKQFAPSESQSQKPPSEAQARSKIAALTASREKFKKTDKIDMLAQRMFPELKIASQTGDQKEVDKAYNEAIEYYRQFTGPQANKRKTAIKELKEQGMPITDANIEYAIGLME